MDFQTILAAVEARRAARTEITGLISRAAERRALEVAQWRADRQWPVSRLREAWVVARFGPAVAADSGPAAAGALTDEDMARLCRAARRYETHVQARPDGWPEGGLAALLWIGRQAHQNAGSGTAPGPGPRRICWAIGGLDQLSRRMRALATEHSDQRLQGACRRAGARFTRRWRAWPSWILCDEHDEPLFDQLGMVQIDPDGGPPAPGSDGWRLVVRDVYLCAGRRPPLDHDGRALMADRHRHPSSRAPRPRRATDEQYELAELARRTGIDRRRLVDVDAQQRAGMLADLRRADAAHAETELNAFHDRLAEVAAKIAQRSRSDAMNGDRTALNGHDPAAGPDNIKDTL